ncbi:MAG: AsnC family transcriptional regulator [Gammaproteobacteria bacterium RIFCSPLOWO2_02_FULL_52_10]|nr:MAG: AsnC family transcriptional regulator [Gammaproteobacteria bacterium RIFCSPLOWO2_02_FULL_52_10]
MLNPVKLDKADKQILFELQSNSRQSNQELADKIGISTAACWRRVRALENNGVIKRYAAILEPGALGMGQCLFAHVRLEKHTEESTLKFVAAIQERPEVMECYAVTGDFDYILRIVAADVAAYDNFLRSFLFKLPGIAQVQSNMALREIKFDTALPIT